MEEQNVEISLESVFEAYYSCRKNKRKTFNALEFEANYESNCVKLWREINNKSYQIGKSITFVVVKPRYREVFAADFRDRVVHHIIAQRIEPLFESVFITDNYNCRKGKGTLYGVKRLYKKVKKISNNYTEDCYIGKFDMQGFFMSIHKPTLWNMLKDFLNRNYYESDKDILMWLVEKVVKHCPEKNCIRKCPIMMWDHIPPQKSLFTTGDDYGLPIGNLTSQMFANFYLHYFDIWMKNTSEGYGRYVDDFYIIEKDKDKITSKITDIKNELKNKIGVILHPEKLYIQHYEKGCKFTGSVVKKDRLYVGSYTVGQFYNRIRGFNKRVNEKNYIENNAEHFVGCINSYLGFLQHYKSYNIKRKLIKLINPAWFEVCYISGHFDKIVCKNKYKNNIKIKLKVLNQYKNVTKRKRKNNLPSKSKNRRKI